MNRTKVEKLLGKRVTVTLTDGDIITAKLPKTGEEEFKDNPNSPVLCNLPVIMSLKIIIFVSNQQGILYFVVLR